MRSRSDLIEIFSTFLLFDLAQAPNWVVDVRLRRSMLRRLAQLNQPSDRAHLSQLESGELFWVFYWFQSWQNAPEHLALSHLSAYLQEACYWSAYRISQQFSSSAYQLADYFQIAIADLPKILSHCNLDSSLGLKAYASVAFSNAIRDRLRQQREVDLCSDWGLLLKVSRKRLQAALEQSGLNPQETQNYLLAWKVFTEVYTPASPGLNKLSAPTATQWTAIAQRYHQERRMQSPPESARSPQILEQWLIACARQVRAYLYPSVDSLHQPRFAQADSFKEGAEPGQTWEMNLPDGESSSLLDLAIAQEDIQHRQEQRHQINQVLKTALEQLDPSLANLIQMYYQGQLTQQEMAKALNLQQYAVSRKLAKAREKLLLALGNWSQETLHIAPTSNVIKSMSGILEEWLHFYYQPPSPRSPDQAE